MPLVKTNLVLIIVYDLTVSEDLGHFYRFSSGTTIKFGGTGLKNVKRPPLS